MATITSPGVMPAFSAGDFGVMPVTSAPAVSLREVTRAHPGELVVTTAPRYADAGGAGVGGGLGTRSAARPCADAAPATAS